MMPRTTAQEVVLYYNPKKDSKINQMKGVLVRMGIRIKNVTPEQVNQTIGELLGISENEKTRQSQPNTENGGATPPVPEEMLIMYKFTSRRIDELLLNLRKAKIPKVELKAIVTENNVSWTFCHLYEELKEEHEKMQEMQ